MNLVMAVAAAAGVVYFELQQGTMTGQIWSRSWKIWVLTWSTPLS